MLIIRKYLLHTALLLAIIVFGACPEDDACAMRIQTSYGTYGNTTEAVFNFFKPVTKAPTPLVIVVHQGGFVTGSKDDLLMKRLCDDMGRCGVAAAAINYELIVPNTFSEVGGIVLDIIQRENSVKKQIYHAIQDVKTAVRYFRANANTYNIDPNQIHLVGYSAGAMAVLHAVFMSDEEARQHYFGPVIVEQEHCMDCRGGNPNVSSAVKGALAINGALFSSQFISDTDTTALLLAYGKNDQMVNPGAGMPLQKYVKDIKIDLPSLMFELGIVSNQVSDTRTGREQKRKETTITGFKTNFFIPDDIMDMLRNIFTSEMYGSTTIRSLAKGGRLDIFVAEGGHNFLLERDGTPTEDYQKLKEKIIAFVKPNITEGVSTRRERH